MATNKRLIKSNDEGGGGGFPAFNTVLYDGNGGTQSITGVGFQPDFVWIKNRDDSNPHALFDSVRGAGKFLSSQSTAAETGNTGDLLGSFDADGFQVNRNYLANTGWDTTNGAASPLSYVAWCWKAGGPAVSNTDGTITSQVSANTEAGFSIVSYTGNNIAGATIGHGLGVEPDMIIVKNRDTTDIWTVQHSALTYTDYIDLSSGNAATTNTGVWYAQPTAEVFSFGANPRGNGSGNKHIAYCFAEVAGFSKFGSYVGNGVARTISLDFTPAFVMIKRTGTTGSWQIFDNKRSTYRLLPNYDFAESQTAGTNDEVTLVPNGFTLPTDGGNGNNSALAGNTYIYMAFANQF